LPGVEIDQKVIVDSTGALALPKVPKHMVVIGGGVIGLELGSVWLRLGAQVTVVEYLDQILPGMDGEVRKEAAKIFKKQGFNLRMGTKVTGATVKGGMATLTVEPSAGGASETIEADCVLVAIGRRPNTDGLAMEKAGLAVNARGQIEIGHDFQTNVPGIYAIGDVVGSGLAHTATAEGLVAAENICGHDAEMNYRAIPSCIYTEPEVASFGLSEEAARQAGYDVQVGTFTFQNLAKAMAINERDGFVKVVADKKYGELLGFHIIGPHATDLIHEGVVSIQLENTVKELMKTVHAHPSLAEAVGQANEDVLGMAIDKG
jgi:dihydrolipoamide dehydrogenase